MLSETSFLNFDHYEQFQYVKNRGVTFQNSDSGIQKCNDHVSSTLRYHQKKSDDRIVCRKFVRERVEGETQWWRRDEMQKVMKWQDLKNMKS